MNKDESKSIGGKARAASLTAEERSEIAKKAAEKRWGVPESAYMGELVIGDMVFPCSVLTDGSRILTQSDFMNGMGMYYSGWVSQNKPEQTSTAEIPHFLAFKSLTPFVNKHLGGLQEISVKYKTSRGNIALGIKAEIIPTICDIWLDADESINLGSRQKQIAAKAKIMMRSLAHVGIVALVDEATGFQRDRASDALAQILEKYIAKELQPWVKTFPDEYYEQLFKLRGLDFPNDTVKKPQYFGHLTNDIIYKRLAPKVLDELKNNVPKDAKGRSKKKLFQLLTPELGHPKLREHMASVLTIMKLSSSYDDFKAKLDMIHPQYNETMSIAFDGENEEATGI